MTPRLGWALGLMITACTGGGGGQSSAELGGSSSGAATGTEGSSGTSTGGATEPVDASSTSPAEASSSTTSGGMSRCWDDLEVGGVDVLHEGFVAGSEGIAFGADGRLIVTTNDDGAGTLWEISPEGEATPFAELPYALGLAPRGDGGFVVASIGEIMAPDGGVYEVSASGRASLVAEGIDSPNFVALAGDGSALISDDFDTRVFRVDADGTVSTIIEDVASPNGLAFSPTGDAFYVASTFSPDGEVTRYDVGPDGLPIEATAVQILQLGTGAVNDGIAVDAEGFVYVLANLRGEMWRVDGGLAELQEGERVADGLESPASMAFGRGPGFDPCSAYVTELFGTRVVRVSLGVEGAPLRG